MNAFVHEVDRNQSGYVQFPHLAGDAVRNGKLALNRYSSHITHSHDFPPAKVCHNCLWLL